MHELDADSEKELDELCTALGQKGDQLRATVARVCADPSGQRQPRHSYTRKFENPGRYVRVPAGAKVFEFKPNQWRALFLLVEERKAGKVHRLVFFVPVGGRRFFPISESPWH